MSGDFHTVASDRLEVEFRFNPDITGEISNVISDAVSDRYDVDASDVVVENARIHKRGVDATVIIRGV